MSSEGFLMPAEWERHQRCWMGWPQRPDVWRENAMPAQHAFVQVAEAISKFEAVTVCAAADQPTMKKEMRSAQVKMARRMLPDSVHVMELPQDDSWFRDTGPVFVVRRDAEGNNVELRGNDFVFNSWGEKNVTWQLDAQIAARIMKAEGLERIKSDLVLEGGSIHVDGQGTLLTTEECLLKPNRNAGLSKPQIEAHLKEHLGVQTVIWLPLGLCADEDTDGHVDNFACFAAPGRVLLAWTDDKSDPQYERSQRALDVLSSATDARGRRFEVIKMPLPPPLHISQEEAEGIQGVEGAMVRNSGDRLAASYVNFYIANGGVVAPSLGDAAADAEARQVLQQMFPTREVVLIPMGRELLLGGGNVHCVTCQQPAV